MEIFSFVLRLVSELYVSSKNYFRMYFLFFKILTFYFFYFSKNNYLGNFFQKRFTGGICDLGGYGSDTHLHPIGMAALQVS